MKPTLEIAAETSSPDGQVQGHVKLLAHDDALRLEVMDHLAHPPASR